ncbi:COG1361 S-layer family protein [Clostridium formicaceticum]|uniref:CARDB domain-containing protein n=1 Tax=Clostridium formicaceticum TaxID=1497 RepID=A0AAC9RMW6_9CLOT|nr:CARDB domain-containing protein [Clostridium formicaceticum]AOY77608.1 hypothetical protein BJL90_18140 [Clostridium formicaceticum]ARE88188.1 hypothetical protein CLFO_25890 [Clostridium formicaceticum]
MKYKFFCLLLISTILVNILYAMPLCAEANTGTYQMQGDVIRDNPNLIIGRNYKIPVFKAGTEARLSIPIENTTNGEAVNIFVSLTANDLQNVPFEIDGLFTKKKVSSIYGRNTENAVFNLNIRKNAEAKTYPLTLNIEYTSSNGGSFSLTETIYIKIENDYEVPSLKLMDTTIEGGKLVSGSTKTVGFRIQNSGDLTAKDIKARLGGFSSTELILDSALDTINIQSLAGGEARTVYYNISANSQLEEENYSLTLFLTYKDEYDVPYETEIKVYLPLETNASKEIDLAFSNLIYPENPVVPYENFTVSFNLKNTGDEDADNVRVSVDGGEEILPKSMSIKSIGSLAAGKETPVEFTLFAKDDIESKNYPIKVTVEYEVKTGSKKELQSVSQYIGVFVNSDDEETGIPKVIVDYYDYGKEFIEAGTAFPLNISFYNTHKSNDVRNIRVSISSDGDIFSPVGSSNSFYIDKINANSRVERTVSLRPKINAEYKTHNIFVDIEYEDTKGKDHSIKELIGIPVIQETSLMIGDIITPTENYLGSPIGMSLEFYNAGRGLMRNMMISIEGDFDTQEGSLYIGNLEAGKNNYYDATIIPTSVGTLIGKIIFSYDDEINQHFSIEKEFTLEISEQMQEFMPEPFQQPENVRESSGRRKLFVIIGIIIVGGIVGITLYRRRKKRLEEVDMYE